MTLNSPVQRAQARDLGLHVTSSVHNLGDMCFTGHQVARDIAATGPRQAVPLAAMPACELASVYLPDTMRA